MDYKQTVSWNNYNRVYTPTVSNTKSLDEDYAEKLQLLKKDCFIENQISNNEIAEEIFEFTVDTRELNLFSYNSIAEFIVQFSANVQLVRSYAKAINL